MRLNFSNLSEPMKKSRGQLGTEGTPLSARLPASPSMPRTAGTTGDTQKDAGNLSPLVPSLSPEVGTLKPSIDAVSPVSPLVPTKNSNVELDARIAELDRLIDLVAAHHGFTQADIDEAQEHAHADIEDALTCFRALVREINGATR